MGIARTSPRTVRATAPATRALGAPVGHTNPQAARRFGGLAAHYDQIIDAMNRLPRPVLMILTVALFGFAALDPAGFAARMQALSQVPEPLWWMQGAVVTFYFGAREAHYSRQGKKPAAANPKTASAPQSP